MNRYKRLIGFTLVEVLITVTLSFLLTGLGLVVYKDYYNRKIVKVVADNWAKELELIIKETDSGSVIRSEDMGAGCQGTFLATVVEVTAGSKDYSIYLKCSQANSNLISRSLETNDPAKVVVFGNSRSLEILPLSKGVKDPVSFDICLQTDQGNQCYYQVRVKKSGVVNVE